MEKVFQTILRWLELDDEFEVRNNNIVVKIMHRNMFEVIVERIGLNITLNYSVVSVSQDKIVLERREYVDGFWGRCRLVVERTLESTIMEYRFLGYEAVVGGSVVLVDSIKTMVELGD